MSLEQLARSKIMKTSKIVNNLPIRLGKFGTQLSKLICWSELESSVIQVLAPVTALLMENVLKYAYDLLTTWISLNEYSHLSGAKELSFISYFFRMYGTLTAAWETPNPRNEWKLQRCKIGFWPGYLQPEAGFGSILYSSITASLSIRSSAWKLLVFEHQRR